LADRHRSERRPYGAACARHDAAEGAVTEFPVTTRSNPAYITTGPDGNLWFTEDAANKIVRMTTSGTVTEFSNSVLGNS
jgi:streptogramin lyase